MKKFFNTLFTKNSGLTTDQLIVKKTAISFFFFFVFIIAAIWGWKTLRKQPNDAQGANKLTRAALNANEAIFKGLVSDKKLAKEYPVSLAVRPARVNGDFGLKSKLDSAAWTMNVVKKNGDTLKIKLDDIKKLPKTEIVFNFKCIEGWSQVTHWGGVRFSEFIKSYGLGDEKDMKYVGLSTPDKEYYVGIDMPSAMHPQTLLCYELNDKALPLNQGYPLRLIIPVKYGVKSIKRIGTIYFDNSRPKDYWAEKGYDYFSGL
jgi:DMSO/TMAO reductase YedYZ molybdopterin-dependent catalytic subunit